MTPADQHLIAQLKALGHPDRLRLVGLLSEPNRFPDNLVDPVKVGICVNDLARAAQLPQSTTSTHLTQLVQADLLEISQHGRWRYVRAKQSAFTALGRALASLPKK